MKTNQVTKINNVSIIALSENGSQLIPIRPICDALGISSNGQIEKIKIDPLLSSTGKTVLSVGADGKGREMFALPIEFVFGWLFRIDSRNVKPEAKEHVEKYQLECYRALFEYFAEPQIFLMEKQKGIDQIDEKLRAKQEDYDAARAEVKELKSKMSELKSLTIDDWRANKRQLSIVFEDHPVDVEADDGV